MAVGTAMIAAQLVTFLEMTLRRLPALDHGRRQVTQRLGPRGGAMPILPPVWVVAVTAQRPGTVAASGRSG